MKIRKIFFLAFLLAFLATPVRAQGNPPAGPVYIIQPGDTFYDIALRFGLTLDELTAANPDVDPGLLSVGQQIVIPGLDIQGVLTTHTVAVGETWQSLVRKYRLDETTIYRLNHLTAPTDLYAGYSLIVTEEQAAAAANLEAWSLAPEETLLEAAIQARVTPWTLTLSNGGQNPATFIPGETLYRPGQAASETALPAGFQEITLTPLPLYQGATAVLTIQAAQPVTLSGELAGFPLHFFPLDAENNRYVALQGVEALAEPGLYNLTITATAQNGQTSGLSQRVIIRDGGYYSETLLVPPETIDPQTNEEELNWLLSIVNQPPTSEKYWSGIFQNPSAYPDCFTSRYGTRRLYKGAGTDLQYNGFHSGLDFCGGAGLPIKAPADGVVIFAGPKTIRGNATIIDHGWGVYSGIWHQSEIYVKAGDRVTGGQVIGLVGGTGRVTGAHLHWEVWVNGVQVNPMPWLERAYP